MHLRTAEHTNRGVPMEQSITAVPAQYGISPAHAALLGADQAD